MKLLALTTSFALLATISFAKEIKEPQKIYQKKCAMCHLDTKPKTKEERILMVAPPMDMVMRNIPITIDALDGPYSKDKLRGETIAFMKDYMFEPNDDKANCEGEVLEKFGRMPSMKGFITKDQVDIVIPWVYDKYRK